VLSRLNPPHRSGELGPGQEEMEGTRSSEPKWERGEGESKALDMPQTHQTFGG